MSVEWHGQPLHLYVTHLEAAPTAAGEQRRFAEVKALLNVLEPQADRPQILCGDFNALSPKDSSEPAASLSSEAGAHAAPVYQVPRLSIPQILACGFVDCFRRCHPTLPGYTSASWDPVARRDYVCAAPALAPNLLSCEVIGKDDETAAASDHFPLRADFAL